MGTVLRRKQKRGGLSRDRVILVIFYLETAQGQMATKMVITVGIKLQPEPPRPFVPIVNRFLLPGAAVDIHHQA
jgi:hypothetical protein